MTSSYEENRIMELEAVVRVSSNRIEEMQNYISSLEREIAILREGGGKQADEDIFYIDFSIPHFTMNYDPKVMTQPNPPPVIINQW